MNKDILFKILNELQLYKRPKSQLLQQYVNDRLNKNLLVYYKKLSNSVLFLEQSSAKRVLTNLNKEDIK